VHIGHVGKALKFLIRGCDIDAHVLAAQFYAIGALERLVGFLKTLKN
jgi:hypothetical protein